MQERRRHKLHIAIACLFVALGARANAQTFDDFFNDNLLQDIRIVISPASWRDLQAHYLENNKYQAEFHWNFKGMDVVVSKVAIHSRGRGSRTPVKPNLRVSFDFYVAKQQLVGLSSIILKANTEDASQLRERVIFNLFRKMGLPASRETHVRLFINSDYQGLYLLTEDVDEDYLKRYLGESTGYSYNFVPLDNRPGGYHFEYLGSDPNNYSPLPFEPENHDNDPDPKPLEAFFRIMNQTSDADFAAMIGAYTDPKLFLAHIALENYIAEADGILGDVFGANNFHFYRFAGKNFSQFLVWDKDLAFDSAQRDIFQNVNQNVLSRRITAMPAGRAQYLEMIAKILVLAGGPGGWFEQEHTREYNQIHQAALDDPNKQYQVAGVETPATNEIFEAEIVKNGNFIRNRYAFVLPALTAAGFQPGGPTISNGGVVNAAASRPGPLAPGTLASIYGSNLAPTTAQATTLPLSTTLGGITVYVNGLAAPLLYVSPVQINLQVPWELGLGNGTAPFTVIVAGPAYPGTATGSPFNGTLGNTITTAMAAVSPALFSCGSGPCAVHADNTLVTPQSPAGAGEALVVYANGLGPVDNPVASGQPAPIDKLSRTIQSPAVNLGGVAAQVLFSGLTPSLVGLYQINLIVPPGVTPGTATPLVVSIGGQSATTTIATR